MAFVLNLLGGLFGQESIKQNSIVPDAFGSLSWNARKLKRDCGGFDQRSRPSQSISHSFEEVLAPLGRRQSISITAIGFS